MPEQERTEFPGHDGGLLAARIERPSGPLRGWVLFAHCFSCSKDISAARQIAGALAAAGLGVMRFDFTGLGHSDGDFANTNFSTNVEDLVAASRWLAARHPGPQVLVGHSLGGAAAIVAAHELPHVSAVATIGAPADAAHVVEAFKAHVDAIETHGEAEVSLAGRPFRIQKHFLDDVRGAKVTKAAEGLKRPLLILHAPLDASVGIDNATRLFVAAKHPKSFLSLDTADHLLTQPADARRAGNLIAAWAAAYLPATDRPVPEGATTDKTVRVTETGRGAYENSVETGVHRLIVDEPASLGGGNRGPDPYALLGAALVACTSITLRMYADRKGWPLEQVAVAVRHSREHAADCAQCEEGVPADVFERALTLSGPLDADQRQRLLEIADKCPVHRTLETPGLVRTTLST